MANIKTFVDDVDLPASDLNNYLMKQAVIACTSTTRPASPVPGMHITETDTGFDRKWSGSAWVHVDDGWTTYTPLWQAAIGTPTTGTDGSLTGTYKLENGGLRYLISHSFGTAANGLSGAEETLNYTLPSPFVADSGLPKQCGGNATLSTPGYADWPGQVMHYAGTGTVAVFFPTSISDTRLSNWRSCDSTAALGSGRPVNPGNFSVTDNGNCYVSGFVKL